MPISEEDRKRLEEEEIHRYMIRERLMQPKRRRRWILGVCAISLFLTAWFGWTILEEAIKTNDAVSTQEITEKMRAYEAAAAVVIQAKTADYGRIRPRIAPFSVQSVGNIGGVGRYRVDITYEMFGGRDHAIYAVRCSAGLCDVEF